MWSRLILDFSFLLWLDFVLNEMELESIFTVVHPATISIQLLLILRPDSYHLILGV